MPEIKVKCGGCSQKLALHTSLLGRDIDCPACEMSFAFRSPIVEKTESDEECRDAIVVSRTWLYVVLMIMGIYSLCLGAVAYSNAVAFKRLHTEAQAGEVLPATTEWLLQSHVMLWLFPVVIFMIVFFQLQHAGIRKAR